MQQGDNGVKVFVDGRIVWTSGDLFKGAPKFDDQTRQPVIDARTGQQVIIKGFGLAVAKADLHDAVKGAIWTASQAEAQKLYPTGLPPDFAWKYKDGDGIDHLGQPFNKRAGHAGCLIYALTTQVDVQFFKYNEQKKTNEQVDSGIKCGDWVRVAVTVKAHPPKGRGKPGLYLNPTHVQYSYWGEEIVNRPTGDQVFGASAPVIPHGQSLNGPSQGGHLNNQMPGQGYQPPTNGQAPNGGAPGAANPNWNVIPGGAPQTPNANAQPPGLPNGGQPANGAPYQGGGYTGPQAPGVNGALPSNGMPGLPGIPR